MHCEIQTLSQSEPPHLWLTVGDTERGGGGGGGHTGLVCAVKYKLFPSLSHPIICLQSETVERERERGGGGGGAHTGLVYAVKYRPFPSLSHPIPGLQSGKGGRGRGGGGEHTHGLCTLWNTDPFPVWANPSLAYSRGQGPQSACVRCEIQTLSQSEPAHLWLTVGNSERTQGLCALWNTDPFPVWASPSLAYSREQWRHTRLVCAVKYRPFTGLSQPISGYSRGQRRHTGLVCALPVWASPSLAYSRGQGPQSACIHARQCQIQSASSPAQPFSGLQPGLGATMSLPICFCMDLDYARA